MSSKDTRGSDSELGIELPEGCGASETFDVDVVKEGRSDGGHIEVEAALPHLTDGAGREGAVGIASGAGEVLFEDLDALEIAGELDLCQGGAGSGGPGARNVEVLTVVGLDWVGVSDAGRHNPVFCTRELDDGNGVRRGGFDEVKLVGGGSGSKKGVLEHLEKRINYN